MKFLKEEWVKQQQLKCTLFHICVLVDMITDVSEQRNESILVVARCLAHECRNAHSLSTGQIVHSRSQARSWTEVRWTCPNEGWFKVNSDGAHCQGDRRTARGGVVHNSDGEWILSSPNL
ncbi:hypothetical protein V6N13_013096 [Hibiscus sabdariffa]